MGAIKEPYQRVGLLTEQRQGDGLARSLTAAVGSSFDRKENAKVLRSAQAQVARPWDLPEDVADPVFLIVERHGRHSLSTCLAAKQIRQNVTDPAIDAG